MSSPRQLALDLPHRPALSRDDFLVSGSNARAVAAMDAWPDWPHPEYLLVGPAGSGKSHLVAVWRARTGALALPAGELAGHVAEAAAASAVAVEDCGPGLDEEALFHLLNAVRARGGHVLLTGHESPAAWRLTLPDLVSRLRRMPVAELTPPDDALVEAVLMKLFADRQLAVEPTVVPFLARRLERSFAALSDAVARLDRIAIEERRRITRALAARVVDNG